MFCTTQNINMPNRAYSIFLFRGHLRKINKRSKNHDLSLCSFIEEQNLK